MVQRIVTCNVYLFVLGATFPQWTRASSFTRFLDHTQRHTTVGRTPLDEWSARRRDLYLTTHNTHKKQTSMPSVWFEPTISAGERPQTHALDRVATGIGRVMLLLGYILLSWIVVCTITIVIIIIIIIVGFIIRKWPSAVTLASQQTNNNNNNNNNNNKLQLGCHPVAVVILHVNKIRNWLLLNLSREGYMRSM